jgi:hypothetical protein
MEQLRYVSESYNKQLKDLASLLNTQVEVEYQPSPYDIEDARTGFDSEGCYHHPSLRTEHLNG